MIESHTFIEIMAPHYSEELKDNTTIKRMACNFCNGTGTVLEIEDDGIRNFPICPCCGGTRFVDAVITITFEPSKFVLMKSKL